MTLSRCRLVRLPFFSNSPRPPPKRPFANAPNHRGDPRRDARSETAPGIPRQLRQPPDPPQSLPIRDILSPLEMRGRSHANPTTLSNEPEAPTTKRRGPMAPGMYADGNHSKRDTSTKSANTSSSSSVWPRWTSSGRRRAVQGATRQG